MIAPPALGNSQPWAREVTQSIAQLDGALTTAHSAAGVADRNIENSITRSASLLKDAAIISDFLLTLAVVQTESRTNAIGI